MKFLKRFVILTLFILLGYSFLVSLKEFVTIYTKEKELKRQSITLEAKKISLIHQLKTMKESINENSHQR